MEQFDAIIIGIGQAGNPLASELSKHGLKTAVIEKKYAGGSCINYGCTPTKTMVASAHARHIATRGAEYGFVADNVRTDFKQVISRRDALVESWRNSIDKRLREDKNITLIYGGAAFSGKKEITLKLNDGGERILTAEKIFINTGTYPRIPEIKGLNETNYYTAQTIMDLSALPEHLIILGGGYIGLEFGQMYARFGSKVSVIEAGGQLASREDEDVAEEIKKILEADGVNVYLNTKVQEVKNATVGIEIITDNQTIKGSHLLVAIGTAPATEKLNLEAAGIHTDDKGYIEVNEYLETNIAGVYALGDCKGGPEFTHISYDDYRIVKDHLWGDKKRSTKDRSVPYAMFTKPELGRIGLNEKQAKEKDIKYRLASMSAAHIARAVESAETAGMLKVLIGEDDKIIGAACMTETGGEMMTMLQLAMMGGLSHQQLRDAVFAHPTWAETFNNLFMNVKDPE